ncbi:phosphatase PAP2 family protein [Dehalococcoidia bacterium]|nr:phosphatase PAP2 family protein [Dehalococcoidia bacterium]
MANTDERLFLWLNGFVGTVPFLDRLTQLLVSDYLVPMTLALALVVLWYFEPDKVARQRNQIGVFVALTAMGLASLAVFWLNAYYDRPRPFETLEVAMLFYKPTDPSFPSNATAAVFGIATTVWGVNRRMGSALLAAAGLYGLARVYAGVHYPMDVVAGAIIGAAMSYLAFRLRDLLMPVLVWVIKAMRILCLA